MKQLDTNNNEPQLIERPLFSSTLLALFMVLRKNYYERNAVATREKSNLKALAKDQSVIRLV